MFWPRIFSFLTIVWFLVFWELANFYPSLLIVFGLFAWLVPAAFLFFWLYRLKRQKLPIHHLAAVSIFFIFGLSLFLPMVDRQAMRQVLILFSGFLLYFDLVSLVLFAKHHQSYIIGSLEQVNLVVLSWSVFLFSAFLFGWATFLAKIFWPILLTAAVFFFAVFGEIFFLRKIDWRKSYLYSLTLSILAGEFFWAIALWPIGFITKAIILSLIIMYLAYLSQAWLLEIFNRRRALVLTLGAGLSILIITWLAKWI